MNKVIIPAYVVAVAAIAAGSWRAETQEPVYAAPTGFVISRSIADDGYDRVTIDVQVSKLLNCDLESGRGPVWIDFSDPDDLGVPPPSPFFRPAGSQAGKTIGKSGDRYWLRG